MKKFRRNCLDCGSDAINTTIDDGGANKVSLAFLLFSCEDS